MQVEKALATKSSLLLYGMKLKADVECLRLRVQTKVP